MWKLSMNMKGVNSMLFALFAQLQMHRPIIVFLKCGWNRTKQLPFRVNSLLMHRQHPKMWHLGLGFNDFFVYIHWYAIWNMATTWHIWLIPLSFVVSCKQSLSKFFLWSTMCAASASHSTIIWNSEHTQVQAK